MGRHVLHLVFCFIQGIHYQNGQTCYPSCILLYTRHPLSKRAGMFSILYFALYKASVITTGMTCSPSCILPYTRHPLSQQAWHVPHLVFCFIQGIRYHNRHDMFPVLYFALYKASVNKTGMDMFPILYFALYKASIIKTGRHVHHLVICFIQGIRYRKREHAVRPAVLSRWRKTNIHKTRAEGCT